MRRTTFTRLRSRRIAAALAVVATVTAVAVGCGGESSSSTGSEPAEVAAFIPAGAPAYFEVSTDFDGEQWQQVVALAKKFPSYPKLEQQIQKGLSEEGVDFERDVRPLLGDRAAVAALRAPDTDATVTDEATASDAFDDSGFVAAIALAEGKEQNVKELLVMNGAQRQERDGTEYFTDEDSASAVTDGTLVVSDTPDDLFTALDAQKAGGDRTLAGSSRFTDALARLPGDTFAQGYLDLGALVQQATASSTDRQQLEALGIRDYESSAIAMSLASEEQGMRFKGIVTGVPESAAQATEFAPELLENVPADAIAYVGVANLAGQVERLVGQIRAAGGNEVAQQIDGFAAQLPQVLPGVTIDDLAALARGEHAFVVTQGTPTPGVGAILRVEDGARAQKTLDTVRQDLPNLLSSLGGVTLPPWRQVSLSGGVRGWELPVSPEASVVYGVGGDLTFLGSSVAAVQSLQAPDEPLSGSADYQAGTAGIPDKVTSVVWLNVQQGVAALDAAGALDEADAETRANLRPLKSVVAWSTGGDAPTFEAFVRIAD